MGKAGKGRRKQNTIGLKTWILSKAHSKKITDRGQQIILSNWYVKDFFKLHFAETTT